MSAAGRPARAGVVHVSADPAGAAAAVAARIAELLARARRARGRADAALAGGSTPRLAYRLLRGELEWSHVHLWLGDERIVRPDDPESNQGMVAAELGEAVGPAGGRLHRVEVQLGAAGAARAYARELRAELPGADGIPVLDLALQGVGEDGHTASLFPRHQALAATEPCVAVDDAPKPPPERVTLTLPVLRAARHVLFLITGAAKRRAVGAILAGPDPGFPASLLAGPRTEIYADEAAVPRGRAST